jgi:thiamine pyrophosphokinase
MKIKNEINFIDLILVDYFNISFLLNDNMNYLIFPEELITKKGIGILPFEKSVISTRGLKWDVSNFYYFYYHHYYFKCFFIFILLIEKWETSLGGNLTICNEIENGDCKIFVEKGKVYFTAELRD